MKHDHSFEELCEIVAPIAEKYGAGSIYLFGSRARGDNSEKSDYDFFVTLGQIRGLKLCGLLRELEEALGNGVDIVTGGAQLEEDFSKEIHREMRLIYES
ncbi:MAG: nucleotidyltransferase domain-containing protein [Methanomassiliicoccaceae archaeon]|nr:nucleotidyltransferase domain-containing protein [Methanomassiliicoccaceae archaeon]